MNFNSFFLIPILSGWQGSNLRPPGPKPGTLPAALHPELLFYFWRRERDSNPRYPLEVRQFSKLFLSATQASLLIFI
jgi:hypothetical protein